MTHTGREPEAIDAARKLIDSFEPLSLDYIVINAAGCGSNVKEYGHLLRDDPNYAARAKAFAAKCRDISEVLTELTPRAKRNPLAMRVAYQDSCHLLHAQRVSKQPRDLLKGIPGIELLELPDTGCCGSAGIYNLIEPQTAHELGERKARTVANTGAAALVPPTPAASFKSPRNSAVSARRCPPTTSSNFSTHLSQTQSPALTSRRASLLLVAIF